MSETNPGGPIIEGTTAPAQPEAEKAKELLNKDRVGLQAALLMDGKKADKDTTIKSLTELKGKSDAPNLETITKSSKFERDNYWKDKLNNEGKAMSFDDKKSKWISSADQILGAFRSSPEQEELLKKLGYDQNKGAKEFYEEFFVEGKGNLGFFGKKLADSFTEDDLKNAQKKSITIVESSSGDTKITRQISLFDALGGFYGQNSSEVAKLVAEGIFNLKHNEEEFKKTAGEQITNLNDKDRELLATITAQSEGWVKNEKARIDKLQQEMEEKRRKAEAEAKLNSLQGIATRVTETYNRIKNSDYDLVKHFLPVLEAFKTKPEGISEDTFRISANAAIEAFTNAESLGNKPDEEQLLNIIDLFDNLGLQDFSKLNDKDKNFVNETRKNILQKLNDKGAELMDIASDKDLIYENAERIEREVIDGKQAGNVEIAHPGFKRAGKVIRKPIYIVYTEKKGGEPGSEESGASLSEDNSKKIGKLKESIDKSDHDFIKHFSPVLQEYINKPEVLSDQAYKDITTNLLIAFSRAENMADKTEKEQALAVISFLDILTFAKTTWELNEGEVKFFEKKEEEFLTLLAEKDIKPIDVKQGDNYDPAKIDGKLEPVNDPAMIDKVIKVHFRRGFTIGDEVLRRPSAKVGAKNTEAAVVNPDQSEVETGAEVQAEPQKGGEGEQAQPAQEGAKPDDSPSQVGGNETGEQTGK